MTRFEKWSVLSTSLLTLLTGVAYAGFKYLLVPADPWAVINHPLQPWTLKAHILVAPLLVFAVGMIAVRHVWQHIVRRVRLGRRSGLVTAASIAPMVLTGYLIQAVTAEALLRALALSHLALGVLYGVAVGIHWMMVRRRTKRARIRGPGAMRKVRRLHRRERGRGERVEAGS